MPLPDERPRQSVANLIGRFETQTKRLSQISASSPSRSSSVVSHITGDSVREEVKEKREWPPKSVADTEKPLGPPSRHLPPALITQSTSAGSELSSNTKWSKEASSPPTGEAEVPLTAKALNASQRQIKGEPNSFLENWRKDIPPSQVDMEPDAASATPEQDQASMATPTPRVAHKFTTPATPRTSNAAKVTAGKPTTTTSSKALAAGVPKTPLAKTTTKSSTTKPPVIPMTPKALKPQHTGQSVASSAAKKPVAKTSSTSIRATTRPDVSGSKTPTSAARPKTPSTGLFAPTAASLARSRNAPPPVPSPPKKAVISSSSVDRLSKPTAASKARVASAQPTTPARPTPTAPRLSATKSKVAATPEKRKKEPAVAKAATGAAVVASVAAVGLTVVALADKEEKVADSAEEVIPSTTSETSEVTSGSIGEPSEGSARGPEAEPEDAQATTSAGSGEVHDQDLKVEEQDAEKIEEHIETEEKQSVGDSDENAPTPKSPSPTPEAEHEVTEENSATEEDVDIPIPEAHQESKDELEDIVNLLESVSITKPLEPSVADIPDEIQEIPGDNDK